MKKTVTIAAITAIIFSGISIPSYAALKDFKSDVEKDEKNSGSSSSGDGDFSSDSGDSCSGGCIDDECFSALFSLWFLSNLSVRYLDYPYAENEYGQNYVIVPPGYFGDKQNNNTTNDEYGTVTPENTEDTKDEFFKSGNIFFFKPEAGMLYAFDEGKGYYASLHGRFAKIIGPELEMRMLDDGNDRLYYYAAGGNLAIAQYGGFMLDAYLQAAYMRGILSRNGAAGGFLMTLYPVKPFTITLKIGFQDYNKIIFYDYEGKIGFIIGRVEFSAGYRYIESESASIKSIMSGVTIHI